MQTIEIETEFDENHEIHVKLPDHAIGPAKVIVLLENKTRKVPRPVELGLFRGKERLLGAGAPRTAFPRGPWERDALPGIALFARPCTALHGSLGENTSPVGDTQQTQTG